MELGDGTVSADTSSEIAGVLRDLAPPPVAVGARTIGDVPIFAAERAHVVNATVGRTREFGSGRALLRALMGRNVPIPVGSDRAPVLPPDVCGSLAHDDRFVVAAVAERRFVRSLGIDIEPAEPLEEALAGVILRPDERVDARLAFVLKEATYKAWHGLGGRMLEFDEVRVSVTDRSFTAEVVPDEVGFAGRYGWAAGRWIALVVVV